MLPKPHEITTPTNKLAGLELIVWVAKLQDARIELDGRGDVRRLDSQWCDNTYYSPTSDDALFVRLLEEHKIALYPMEDVGNEVKGSWYWTAISHRDISVVGHSEQFEGDWLREPTQMRRVQFTGATPELAVLRCYIGMTRPEYKPLPPKCLE